VSTRRRSWEEGEAGAGRAEGATLVFFGWPDSTWENQFYLGIRVRQLRERERSAEDAPPVMPPTHSPTPPASGRPESGTTYQATAPDPRFSLSAIRCFTPRTSAVRSRHRPSRKGLQIPVVFLPYAARSGGNDRLVKFWSNRRPTWRFTLRRSAGSIQTPPIARRRIACNWGFSTRELRQSSNTEAPRSLRLNWGRRTAAAFLPVVVERGCVRDSLVRFKAVLRNSRRWVAHNVSRGLSFALWHSPLSRWRCSA